MTYNKVFWKDFISCVCSIYPIWMERKKLRCLCVEHTQENSFHIFRYVYHSHSTNHCTLGLKSDGNLYGFKIHSCTFLRSIETFFYCVVYICNPFNSKMEFSSKWESTLWNVSVASKSNETIYFCYSVFFSSCCCCSVISIKISMELFVTINSEKTVKTTTLISNLVYWNSNISFLLKFLLNFVVVR